MDDFLLLWDSNHGLGKISIQGLKMIEKSCMTLEYDILCQNHKNYNIVIENQGGKKCSIL